MSRAGTFTLVAVAVIGLGAMGLVVGQFLESGEGRATGEAGAGDAEVAERLERLEQQIDARLARLESRLDLRAMPLAAERSEVEDATTDGGEPNELLAGDEFGTLIGRLEALELQVRSLTRDPVERGFSYLTSTNAELRRQGVGLLARLARDDPDSRAAIRRMLADVDPDVREEALEALEEAGDREALPQVLALLGDAEADVREQAIETLSDLIRDQDGVSPSTGPALISALSDPEADVREEAIDALGRLGDASAIPALRSVYDSSEGERMDAAMALWRLGDREPFRQEASRLVQVLGNVEASERERSRAVETLAFARDEYREVLTRALQDPSERVRREAERALNGRGRRGR